MLTYPSVEQCFEKYRVAERLVPRSATCTSLSTLRTPNIIPHIASINKPHTYVLIVHFLVYGRNVWWPSHRRPALVSSRNTGHTTTTRPLLTQTLPKQLHTILLLRWLLIAMMFCLRYCQQESRLHLVFFRDSLQPAQSYSEYVTSPTILP